MNIPSAKESGADWTRAIYRKLKGAERLFVLGIGNRRRGDDAAGSLCVRLLQRSLTGRKRWVDEAEAGTRRQVGGRRKAHPLEVQVFDAQETPENATGLIREFRPTLVLIIDAAAGGHPPGTIFVVDKENISREDISTHRIPLSYLVRYLEEDIGCRVISLGIEPQKIAWGRPVSAPVRESVAALAAWLAKVLPARPT